MRSRLHNSIMRKFFDSTLYLMDGAYIATETPCSVIAHGGSKMCRASPFLE